MLLTFVEPHAETTALPRGARTATLVLVIAPEFAPGCVRIRVGRYVLKASAD